MPCPSIGCAGAATDCASSRSTSVRTTRLVEVEIEPSTPALADRLADAGIDLVDGQTAEICLALDAGSAARRRTSPAASSC